MLHPMSEHAYELHGDDPGAVERLAQAAGDGEVIYLTRAGQAIAAVVPAALAAPSLRHSKPPRMPRTSPQPTRRWMRSRPAKQPSPPEELWAELGLDRTSR
jgi:antitoxin (DNA-binding transcriptional repressor) of toxin-antitoxin stability system